MARASNVPNRTNRAGLNYAVKQLRSDPSCKELHGIEYGSWRYEENSSEVEQSQSCHRETTRK